MRLLISAVLAGAVATAAFAQGDQPESDASAAESEAPAEPAREPVTQIEGTAPTETLEERMERFKRERGAGSDKPFEGFAAQAEQDAQRRRNEALGVSAEAVEDAEALESRVDARNSLQDKLQELGGWGASNCVEAEPAWSLQDDFTRHRKLTRDDFQFSGARGKAAAAPYVRGAAPSGYAAIVLSCELRPAVNKVRGKEIYVATAASLRYYAVLSRKDSWLSPDVVRREDFVIGHQQLHFDMANAFATWLTSKRDAIRTKLQGFGATPEVALGQLQVRYGEHMIAVHDDFDALELAFDRETKHGGDAEQQTAWSFRLSDGFPAFAKGLRLETKAVTE